MEMSDEPTSAPDLALTTPAADRGLISFAFATMTGPATRSFDLGQKPRSGAALQRPSDLRPAFVGETGGNVTLTPDGKSQHAKNQLSEYPKRQSHPKGGLVYREHV